MDTVTGMLAVFLDNLRGINPAYAGLIALFFGLLTTRMVGVFVMPVAATAVYITAQAILPPLFGHAAIAMPEFDKDMMQHAITLYFVFLVADTTVFAIKSAVSSAPN